MSKVSDGCSPIKNGEPLLTLRKARHAKVVIAAFWVGAVDADGGGDVDRTVVTYVFDAAFGSLDSRFLLDDTHFR